MVLLIIRTKYSSNLQALYIIELSLYASTLIRNTKHVLRHELN